MEKKLARKRNEKGTTGGKGGGAPTAVGILSIIGALFIGVLSFSTTITRRGSKYKKQRLSVPPALSSGLQERPDTHIERRL